MQLLTILELEERKEDFIKLGDTPEYNTIKRVYAYIKEHGAVREDVYEYLLEHMVFQEYSLLSLNYLVKTFAGPEWFQLIKKTEERKNDYHASKGSIGLFQQLILEAYREDIPYNYVVQVLEIAKYPYEVSQKLEQYRKEKREELEKAIKKVTFVIEEFPKEKQDSERKGTEFLSEDLTEYLEISEDKTEEDIEENIELQETENTHMLLLIQSLLEENERQYKGLLTLHTWIKESGRNLSIPSMDILEGSEENTRKIEQETKKEILEVEEIKESTNTIITKESEKKEISLAKIFQKLREWKKITSFQKLTDKKKLEELFRMMNERKYSEKIIIAIRECIALGVSFEFLYTLIEMDAGEEEFEKLILFRSAKKKEEKDIEKTESNYMESDVQNVT